MSGSPGPRNFGQRVRASFARLIWVAAGVVIGLVVLIGTDTASLHTAASIGIGAALGLGILFGIGLVARSE